MPAPSSAADPAAENQAEDPANPLEPTPAAPAAPDPAPATKTFSAEELDAIVKARIDKQNAKHAVETDELNQRLAKSEADKLAAEARAQELEHEREMREWADEAASEFGVPASVLRGDSLDAMKEHAAQIKASMSAYPITKNDAGNPGTPSITAEEISQIKDVNKRVAAYGSHPELFNQ